MPTIRRTKNLVDHEVQYGLVKRICCHWLLFIVCNAVLFFLWVRLFETPVSTWEESFQAFGKQFIPVLIVSLALLPVFLRDTIKLSNRFAGPVTRLKRTLRDLADGQEVEPLAFRSGDFWQTLSNDFNQVVGLKEKPPSNTKNV